jgi:transposase
MIAAAAGVKVLVATKPVDFRRGADSLAAVVREQLQHDPFLCVRRDYVAEAA